VDDLLAFYQRTILEEVELYREPANARALAAVLPGGFKAPRYIEELSGISTVAMEYLPARRLRDLMPRERTEVFNRIDGQLIPAMLSSGTFHYDLHPGNIGVSEDGTVILYDVGRVQTLEKQEMEALAAFYQALQKRDGIELASRLRHMGAVWDEQAFAKITELFTTLQPDQTPAKVIEELYPRLADHGFRLDDNYVKLIFMFITWEGTKQSFKGPGSNPPGRRSSNPPPRSSEAPGSYPAPPPPSPGAVTMDPAGRLDAYEETKEEVLESFLSFWMGKPNDVIGAKKLLSKHVQVLREQLRGLDILEEVLSGLRLHPHPVIRHRARLSYHGLVQRIDSETELYRKVMERARQDLLPTDSSPRALERQRDAVQLYDSMGYRRFPASDTALQGVRALRQLLELGTYSEPLQLFSTYDDLLVPWVKDPVEFEAASRIYQNFLTHSDPAFVREALKRFPSVLERLPVQHEAVRLAAERTRSLMEDIVSVTALQALAAYPAMVGRLLRGDREIELGLEALRRRFADKTGQVPFQALQVYAKLIDALTPGNNAALQGEFADMVGQLFGPGSVSHKLDIARILGKNFEKFHALGLFEELLDSEAFAHAVPDLKTRERIRALLLDNGKAVPKRQWWVDFLAAVGNLDENYRPVFTELMATEGKARNIFSALRALNAIPANARKNILTDLSKEITAWPTLASAGELGRPLRVKRFVHERLIKAVALWVRHDPNQPRLWEFDEDLIQTLLDHQTMGIFTQAAAFMNEKGRRILGDLFDQMSGSKIEDGKILHEKRYLELLEKGFDQEFVDRWSLDHEAEIPLTEEDRDPTQLRHRVFEETQRVLQEGSAGVRPHSTVMPELPGQVAALVQKISQGSIDGKKDLVPLIKKMNVHYQEIRQVYGEAFAQLKDELQKFKLRLDEGGVVRGERETVLISGRPEVMALMGDEPVGECQSLLMSNTYNIQGEPLLKLLHGQFKAAYFQVDGKIVARRTLEVTIDHEGKPALLVTKLYATTRFFSHAAFDREIREHAKALGISEERVYFSEEYGQKGYPYPLDTGTDVYREEFKETVPAGEAPPKPWAA
jgi:hypothetical protein